MSMLKISGTSVHWWSKWKGNEENKQTKKILGLEPSVSVQLIALSLIHPVTFLKVLKFSVSEHSFIRWRK